jgi:hypothetical protein
MAGLAKKHSELLQAEVTRITDEKDLEISDLIDDYDETIFKLDGDFGVSQEMLASLQVPLSNVLSH